MRQDGESRVETQVIMRAQNPQIIPEEPHSPKLMVLTDTWLGGDVAVENRMVGIVYPLSLVDDVR